MWRSEQSGKGLAMASAALLQLDGTERAPSALAPLKWTWQWTSAPGQIASRARPVKQCRYTASRAVNAPGWPPRPPCDGLVLKAQNIGRHIANLLP